MAANKRLVLSILLGIPTLAVAADGYWSSEGPWGGQIYDVIAAPPVPPSTLGNLFVSTRGGIFRSTDGAATWQRANSGIVGSVSWGFPLALDRDAATRLYTVSSTGQLFRSIDEGAAWAPTGYALPVGESPARLADVPGAGNSGVFYLASVGYELATPGALRKTADDGATFTTMGGGLTTATGFNTVAVDPSDANRVLAGTDFGPCPLAGCLPTDPSIPALFRSTNGGSTWTGVFTNGGATGVRSRVDSISFGAAGNVYAVVDNVVLRSTDSGATWAAVAGTTVGVPLRVSAHPTVAATVFTSTTFGVQVSTNGGASFGPVSTGLTPNGTYTESVPPTRVLQGSVSNVAFDPGFPSAGSSIWVSTEGAGLFRSLDGGSTWSGTDVNLGLAAVNVRSLAGFVQDTPALPAQRWFAGFGDALGGTPALYRSPDAFASSWATSNNGLRASNVRSIVIDPTTRANLATTVIYASGTSARFGLGGYYNGGIYKSSNGGSSWSTIDATLPTSTHFPSGVVYANIGTTVRNILLDPRSCTPAPLPPAVCTSGPLQTVYLTATGRNIAGTFQYRVVRSTDGGASWVSRDSGLPQPLSGADPQSLTVVPIVMSPTDSNTLYVGTVLNLQTPSTPTLASGVFKSIDGGATWVQSSTGLPRVAGSTDSALDVLALAIHPADPNVLWATASNLGSSSVLGVPLVSYIYKSTDAGATWVRSDSGIPPGLDLRALIVDASNPLNVYASGAGSEANPGAVYRSSDGGATWVSISVGLPADAATVLALDPVDTTRLHAGTNTGVWSLHQIPDSDADGAPNAIENNAPSSSCPGGTVIGDGNGDCVNDRVQSDVGSSLVQAGAAQMAQAGAITRASARRLAAPEGVDAAEIVLGGGIFTADIVGGTCTQQTNVSGDFAARFGADRIPGQPLGRNFAYPLDLVRFELPGCTQAVVELTFHALSGSGYPDFNDYQWSLRSFGPLTPGVDSSFGWHDIGARATRVGTNKWRVTLDGGQFPSYRPAADSILFVGGPAFSQDRLFANSFE